MSIESGFADPEYAQKKRLKRREKFLNQMEPVILWAKLIALIEPYYPKSGKQGRQPKVLKSCSASTACKTGFCIQTTRWKMHCMRLRVFVVLQAITLFC